MIRTVKQAALSMLRKAGVFELAGRSRWRHNRLLILGYHGISQEDEHLWNPGLFVTPAHFESRIKFLRAERFNVLPLGEALERLRTDTLPERSVVVTFDDGYVDFYRFALPILREYQVPATVYLTTYYSERNGPVPGITAAYMLWKSQGFSGPLTTVPGFEGVRFRDPVERRSVSEAVGQYFTDERSLSAADKHRMLHELAGETGFDLEAFEARRIMHVMTPEEAREVFAAGIDVQLHTHRHWAPNDEELIRCEISDNRSRIAQITGQVPHHFCYPSGIHFPELLPWLRGLGVQSATTCERGLATAEDDPLLLPRFLDHSVVTRVEFEAWASGVASVLPRRSTLESVSSKPMIATRPSSEPGYEGYLQDEWELFARDRSRQRLGLEAVEGLPVKRVLDVGCGGGQDLVPFAAAGATCIGIDIAPESGPFARRLLAEQYPRTRVHFATSGAEQLPFADGTFDVVLCRVALPYTLNRLALGEIGRVLRPGGVLLLKTHTAAYYRQKFRDGLSRRSPLFSLHALRVLATGAIYQLTGWQPRGGVLIRETFLGTRRLRKELERAQLAIVGELADTNPLTPSYRIAKAHDARAAAAEDNPQNVSGNRPRAAQRGSASIRTI